MFKEMFPLYDLEEFCKTSQPHLTFILPFFEAGFPPARVWSVEVAVGWETWIYRHHGIQKKTTQILQMESKCGQLPVVQLNGIMMITQITKIF